MNRAKGAFLDILKRQPQDWNLNSISFCHGYSGLLALTHLMEKDTQDDLFHINKMTLLDLICSQCSPQKKRDFFDE